ncbi:MAG TPA: 1,2-phenylacetyl-CoA epoxidase subunit PaaD [Acetobacteraceae bacterium]|nr:1,2-phenylacetyl-CoA epoxidase subunit PaaD [Acetobacteraceae bacterium]
MQSTLARPPTAEQIWDWLREIPDPEIPVISVVDLGIVRDVRWHGQDGRQELVVTVTPTYSGCPATSVIMLAIENALRDKGVETLRLERRLSPPWTTDWISAAGRQQLRRYGIAPPPETAGTRSPLSRLGRKPATVTCPRCGSANTAQVSQFGSTPCKAQYRCQDCLEPFDYFKCI